MALDQVVHDLRSALTLLRREKEEIEERIANIERALDSSSVRGGPARRGPGRPKGSGKKREEDEVEVEVGGVVRKRKKPVWTSEARERARERMRQYWAGRRKGG